MCYGQSQGSHSHLVRGKGEGSEPQPAASGVLEPCWPWGSSGRGWAGRPRAAAGCFQENCAILRELVTLRAQKSSLLGFSTHADYVLEMNMAKNSQVVATFLGNPVPHPVSRRAFPEWGSGYSWLRG